MRRRVEVKPPSHLRKQQRAAAASQRLPHQSMHQPSQAAQDVPRPGTQIPLRGAWMGNAARGGPRVITAAAAQGPRQANAHDHDGNDYAQLAATIEQQQRTIETLKQVIEYHKGLLKEQKDAVHDLQQRLTRIEGRPSQPPPAPSAPKPQPPGAPKPAVNVPAQAQTARHSKRRRRRHQQQDNDNNDEPEEGDEPSLEEKLAAGQSELDMMVSAFDSSSSSGERNLPKLSGGGEQASRHGNGLCHPLICP